MKPPCSRYTKDVIDLNIITLEGILNNGVLSILHKFYVSVENDD